MIPALLLAGLAAFFALALRLLDRYLRPPKSDDRVEAIMKHLPQTQCAQCGYPGCRPYAEAVAAGGAVDLCPPGGARTTRALAELLGRASPPPRSQPATVEPEQQVALIRDGECIGCTLCVNVCPVDAIVGAQGFLHRVIATRCTGCELCLPPCPVDCIDLLPRPIAS